MADSTAVIQALDALKLKYERETMEDGYERFDITLDDTEHLEATGILYQPDGEEAAFRLLGYVDEINTSKEVEQLRTLLALNGDLPTGAFCLDPDEGVIFMTVNMPVEAVNSEMLEWALEFLFVAQEMYFDEFYAEDAGEELAQG